MRILLVMQGTIQQLITLVGVLIGAVTSYFVTSGVEHAKWRRQNSTRWDQVRLEAYSEYANTVKKYIQTALRIAASRGLGALQQPLGPDEGLERLADIEVERGTRWEKVLMLGDPETISAARIWHESAWKLDWFARGKLTSPDLWSTTMEEANAARARFYECARQNLGIDSGRLPDSDWPRKHEILERLSGIDKAHVALKSGFETEDGKAQNL